MATTKKTAKTAAAKPAAEAAAPKKAPAKKAAPAARKAPAKKAAKPAPTQDDLFAEPVAPKAEPVKKAPAAKKAAPKAVRVAFSVRAEVGSKVFVAGNFNNWDPTAKPLTDKKGDGVFACTVNLPKGTYEYKFVINGTWCADPECTDWVQNDMGTLNSVKIVG